MNEKRITFSRDELVELWRALDLISQEDASAEVNMDAASVKAKASAKKKLSRALGRRDKPDAGTYVDVLDLIKGD